MKLDFPRFQGEDPASRVLGYSAFFLLQYTSATTNFVGFLSYGWASVGVVSRCENAGIFTSWGAFNKALQICFGSTDYNDAMEALTRLKQSSNVVVYKIQFEALSNRDHRFVRNP